jgi:hypothetical protein
MTSATRVNADHVTRNTPYLEGHVRGRDPPPRARYQERRSCSLEYSAIFVRSRPDFCVRAPLRASRAEERLIMKTSLSCLLLLTTLVACNVTRPPIDEDTESGAVRRSDWRPSGPPAPPAVWEDSIERDTVYVRVHTLNLGPGLAPPWEDWDSLRSVRYERIPPVDELTRERETEIWIVK